MHYGFFGPVKHVGSLSKLLEVTKRCHIGLPNFGIKDSFQQNITKIFRIKLYILNKVFEVVLYDLANGFICS